MSSGISCDTQQEHDSVSELLSESESLAVWSESLSETSAILAHFLPTQSFEVEASASASQQVQISFVDASNAANMCSMLIGKDIELNWWYLQIQRAAE